MGDGVADRSLQIDDELVADVSDRLEGIEARLEGSKLASTTSTPVSTTSTPFPKPLPGETNLSIPTELFDERVHLVGHRTSHWISNVVEIDHGNRQRGRVMWEQHGEFVNIGHRHIRPHREGG